MANTPSIWFTLAQRLGGQYVRTGQFGSVTLKARGGTICLERVPFGTQHSDGSSHKTRMSASYLPLNDFTFSVCSNTPLQRVVTLFGMLDIKVGEPGFDSSFVVRANGPQTVRKLLADDVMRRTLLGVHENCWLTIESRDRFKEGAAGLATVFGSRRVIVWERVGLEDDEQRLSAMFEVFVRLLGPLCDLGLADPDG